MRFSARFLSLFVGSVSLVLPAASAHAAEHTASRSTSAAGTNSSFVRTVTVVAPKETDPRHVATVEPRTRLARLAAVPSNTREAIRNRPRLHKTLVNATPLVATASTFVGGMGTAAALWPNPVAAAIGGGVAVIGGGIVGGALSEWSISRVVAIDMASEANRTNAHEAAKEPGRRSAKR